MTEVLPHHPSQFQSHEKNKIPTLSGIEPGTAAHEASTLPLRHRYGQMKKKIDNRKIVNLIGTQYF